ncbi:GntR family transcriptional regulator [Polaromonas sp. P1-6]|nr:GntR family transcriptional regulator [Polaromonas sp. P1-6]
MQTLSQQITEKLRDWILYGRFKPGERIEEIPIASSMGVSRTPVRAALATLASEGLIDHLPKRGYLVRVFELDVILAAYEVRAVLEGLACRSAAQRGLSETQIQQLRQYLDRGDRILAKGALLPEDHEPYQQLNVDLHNTLLEASANPWVGRFVDQANHIPYTSDRIVLWDVGHDVILRSHGDHHRIVEAIIMRDSARAEALMREHVYYAGVIFKSNFQRLMEARVPAGSEALTLEAGST